MGEVRPSLIIALAALIVALLALFRPEPIPPAPILIPCAPTCDTPAWTPPTATMPDFIAARG